MSRRWTIHPQHAERIAQLQRSAGVPAVVAQLLLCRGVDQPEAVRRFLEPRLSELRDPGELPGCTEAAQRLHRAAADGRKITVYGDYDADGISGAALLVRGLRTLGATVDYYVPHRIDEGYGLHAEALRTLAQRGTQLVVTVDCGIASVAEAEVARELGLELIISDHHQPGPALPAADALVHPGLPGTCYPFVGLSGSGVAFKLAWALCQQASQAKRVSERLKNYLLQAVGLAAIGTVADVVPLVDENRVLVRHALASLGELAPLGLRALIDVAGLADKQSGLESEDIAFQLAPRLNAAGRLGQAQLAVELLTTDNAERARALAEYLHELNGSRDSLERSVYLAAQKKLQAEFDLERDSAFVLAERGWHPGVIGIVAGRLAEKHHRPVVLIAFDEIAARPGVGSARSVRGLNLYEALSACSSHLVSHGGHAAAAGLKIEERAVDDFRAAFCEYVAETLTADERVAELWIDAEAPLSALTYATVAQIEALAPFGHGNARPLLCATGVRLREPPQKIGGGGRHLSLVLEHHGVRMRGVAFGGGDQAEALAASPQPLDIAYRPVINTFRGRRTVEIQLADWRPCAAAAAASGPA
jgi:single-stranded-DNA-specific exonuclease